VGQDTTFCAPWIDVSPVFRIKLVIVEQGARMSPFVKDIKRNFNYRKIERDNKCKHRKDHSAMGNHTPSPLMERELQNVPMTPPLPYPPQLPPSPPTSLDHTRTVDTTSSADKPE